MSVGAEKLAVVFKPIIDESMKVLKDHITVQSQEILFNLQGLEARLNILEKLIGGMKKIPKGEKKAAVTVADIDINAVIQQPQGTVKAFPLNKLVYFREQFKSNAAFRQKYTTVSMQALMDKDEQITSKTKEEQKLVAMATWCWKYIKNNSPETYESVEKEFHDAKQMHEAANKPPEQTVEPKTPTSED